MNAYVRRGTRLTPVRKLTGFVSPRLGLHFEWIEGVLVIVGKSGRRFQKRSDRVDDLLGNLDDERNTNGRLSAKLRELGVDPDGI